MGQPRPARPVARRRPKPTGGGPLGRVGALRIVCWQLVVIAVLLAVGRPWLIAGPVLLAAAVVVALTAVRVRDRWLGGWVVLSVRYLLRDRDCQLGDPGAAATAGPGLLGLVAPDAVGRTENLNDEPVFMLSRETGMTAVLRPVAAAADPFSVVPTPETLLPPPQHGTGPEFAVQLVHHAGINRDRPPRMWLALQALRTAEFCQDTDLRLALGNAVRRVRRQSRRLGSPVRGLAEPEVLGTIAALAHVNAGRSRVREQWRHWSSGPIAQAAFQLEGWTELDPMGGQQLVRRLLGSAPQAAVTVAVTARRSPTETEPTVSAVLRLAAAGVSPLAQAEWQLHQLAGHFGVALTRLDGQHAGGMAATLPLGVAG